MLMGSFSFQLPHYPACDHTDYNAFCVIPKDQHSIYLLTFSPPYQLDRDAGRLRDCRARLNFSSLGSCALAGTGLPIDRHMTAEELGFSGPLRNRWGMPLKRLFRRYKVPACIFHKFQLVD